MNTNRRKWLCNCCALGAVQWLVGQDAAAQTAPVNAGPGTAAPSTDSLGQARASTALWSTGCEVPDPTLPLESQDLLAKAFEGLDASQLWDTHCHLLGNGDSGSGCTLHPSLTQGWNPMERMRHKVILDAACVSANAASVDRAYVQRLLELAQGFPLGAKWLLFAFDRAYTTAGQVAPELTTLYVPDSHASAMARQHPQRFEWVASVHPYRADAHEALRQAAAQGARAVKWLPSAMNIALTDARSIRFAALAGQLRLPLIVHCGEEKAMPGAKQDAFGNPLHVRGLLEQGATVVVAHCASLGYAVDTDKPSRPKATAFELFSRLMQEKAHEGRLLGDVSAVFQANRAPAVWSALLKNEQWHGRLLNGSDYPLPGIAPLTRIGKLEDSGLISTAQASALGPIRQSNPLLFDLALKRLASANGVRFSLQVFATKAHFQS